MNAITVNAIVIGSRTDREGNSKITFEIAPQEHAKAAAIAMATNKMLVLKVAESLAGLPEDDE